MKKYVYVDNVDKVAVAASDNPARDFPKLIGELPEGEELPWLVVDVDAKTIGVDPAKKAQELAARQARRDAKLAEKQELQNLKRDLAQLAEDIKTATTVAQIKAILVQVLKFIHLQNKG